MTELVVIKCVDKTPHAVHRDLAHALTGFLAAEGYHFMTAFERIELLVYIAVHLCGSSQRRGKENY